MGRKTEGKYCDQVLYGRITEPIPVSACIYGGVKYMECVEKYGEPAADCIEVAEEAHKLACDGYPEVGMAPKEKKGGKGEKKQRVQKIANTTTTKGETAGPIVAAIAAASAIEVGDRPIRIEVEHVKVKRGEWKGQAVYIDETGRVWEADKKGVIVKYLGTVE